ncbi:MAG: 3-hydroxyacyl-CoA dehydrogenase [Kaistia sp. SCN 65-12]|nr:MAG: 3-hydroxyacyl-CoA dehydrogenase [Kaistia sp. SCN 65-12]
MKVAVIGCGTVGSSWALVFARAGHEVAIYDKAVSAAEAAAGQVADNDGRAAGRVTVVADLAAALSGADYIQESAPERLAIKRELYQTLDGLIGENAVIGSSTSGLPASSFTETLSCRGRCLVAHPINPPHLIPLVELVPAPWTASGTLDFVRRLMEQVGQKPITLAREINGFVVNRLQSALLAEAFRLVQDGVCPAHDVDRAVADGLGLRWSFLGPFATIDLNAANGIAEYCANLGPMYYGLAKEQADPREWDAGLVGEIEEKMRAAVPEATLPARRAWRDRFLGSIVEAKKEIEKALGA